MRPIATANPEKVEYDVDLAEALLQTGVAQQAFIGADRGNLKPSKTKSKANQYFVEAVTIGERLVRRKGDNLAYVYLLARIHDEHASLLQSIDEELRDAALDNALGLAQQLVEHEPSNPDYQYLLGRVLINKGTLSDQKRARNVLEKLVEQTPHARQHREALGRVLNNLAIQMSDLGGDDGEEVLELRERCFELTGQLAVDFPSITSYRAWHAMSHMHLGKSLSHLNQHDKAIAHQDKALALLKQLRSDNPEFEGYQDMLYRVYHNKITAGTGGRDRQVVYSASENYLDLLKSGVTTEGSDEARIVHVHLLRGSFHAELSEQEEAKKHYVKACSLAEGYVKKWPENGYIREVAGEAHAKLTRLYDYPGDVEVAAEFVRSASTLFDGYERMEPLIPSAYLRLSRAQEQAGQLGAAIDSMHGWIAIMRKQSHEPGPYSERYFAKLIANGFKRLGNLCRASTDLEGALAAYQSGAETFWQALKSDAEISEVGADEWESLLAIHEEVTRSLEETRQLDEAATWYQRALDDCQHRVKQINDFFSDADRSEVGFLVGRGLWLQNRGEYTLALTAFRKAEEMDPSGILQLPKRRIILILLRQNRLQEVVAELPGVDELDSSILFLRTASMLAMASSESQYRDLCGEMMEKYAHSDSIGDVERTCKACSILPGVIEPSTLPLATLEIGLEENTISSKFRYWFTLAQAMAHYRLGNTSEALSAIRETQTHASSSQAPEAHAIALSLMAMCEHGLGQKKAANQTLARATTVIEENWPKMLNDEFGNSWPDWLIAETLRREAAALLSAAPTPKSSQL